ncbi:MAG: AAA family ATPase [Leptolyngbyaceae cyanobacterium RU_5_1]|nr:AAA family ATPase [Leptolyngbyaceae cyanobacterium RU_5_1]
MGTDLLPILQQLDRLLERAVSAAQVAYGPEAAIDPYRGLYLSQKDIERVLGQEPGSSPFQTDGIASEFFAEAICQVPRLTWLQQTFDLAVLDSALIILALASEIDLRYERIYAYLQDDVTRKRPSVDLALNLLCASPSSKLTERVHLALDAPLIRHGLLHLIPDPNQPHPSLLAHFLKLDEQVVRWLLGQPGLDARLNRFSELYQPATSLAQLFLSPEIKKGLETLIQAAWSTQKPLCLYFRGIPGVGKRRTAEAIAHHVNRPLLSADLRLAVEQKKVEIETVLIVLLREAKCQSAVLYLSNVDIALSQSATGMDRQLLQTLMNASGITIVSGQAPWSAHQINPVRVLEIDFPVPTFGQRRVCWQSNLVRTGMALRDTEIDTLSDRFRFTPAQIEAAIATAQIQTEWEGAIAASSNPSSLHTLFAAARQHSGTDLASLARKISPKYTWNDLILPTDQLTQLKEICNQVKYHPIVGQQWGFDQKLSLGKGVNVLFSGSPGTGKTMSAEVIANELQLDLYKIDLSQIVSKYIGETEKNLDRVFTAAETANAILLFDEADALFGKRSEVKDAHDRYANLEVAYLLQKMEEYEGITILTTNLRQNLDEAFTRRIRFIVEFPVPDDRDRRRIWAGIFPKQTPMGAEVDLEWIAKQFKLSGGNIRNIALAAAFLAAEDGQGVQMQHLLKAAKREFQKMGRLVNEEEFIKRNEE